MTLLAEYELVASIDLKADFPIRFKNAMDH